MQDVLFIGYLVKPNEVEKLSGSSVAGNNMQWNIVRYLEKYEDIRLHIITVYPVASFPKNMTIRYKRSEIEVTDQLKATRIAFVNFPIIKQFTQMCSVNSEIRRLIKQYPKAILLTYNTYSQIGIPAAQNRERGKRKFVAILADPPVGLYETVYGIKKAIMRLYSRNTAHNIRSCDKVIVLNEHAVNLFAPNKPYVVVEGGLDVDAMPDMLPYSGRTKDILYSGALTDYSGIMALIEAMSYVTDNSVCLHIYGGGNYTGKVKKAVENCKNIVFHGSVPNTEMRNIQAKSYLLVNPRCVDEPISKVTFPSKMFEYLSSGTAVLSTELNGFSKEYLNVMYHVESNDPRLLATEINRIMALSTETLEEKAMRARMFLIKHKSWEKQVKIIHDFLIAK